MDDNPVIRRVVPVGRARNIVEVRNADLAVRKLHIFGWMRDDKYAAIVGPRKPLYRSDSATLIVRFIVAPLALVFYLVERVEQKPINAIANHGIRSAFDQPIDGGLFLLLPRILINEEECLLSPSVGIALIGKGRVLNLLAYECSRKTSRT
jgi:hypothetical protein